MTSTLARLASLPPVVWSVVVASSSSYARTCWTLLARASAVILAVTLLRITSPLRAAR